MARLRRPAPEPKTTAAADAVEVTNRDRLDPRVWTMAPDTSSPEAVLTWAEQNAPALVLDERDALAAAERRKRADRWQALTVEEKRAAIRSARRAGLRLTTAPPPEHWPRVP